MVLRSSGQSGTLVLLLILGGKFEYGIHWVFHGCPLLCEGQVPFHSWLVECFYYGKVLEFVRCFFCTNWDDHMTLPNCFFNRLWVFSFSCILVPSYTLTSSCNLVPLFLEAFGGSVIVFSTACLWLNFFWPKTVFIHLSSSPECITIFFSPFLSVLNEICP